MHIDTIADVVRNLKTALASMAAAGIITGLTALTPAPAEASGGHKPTPTHSFEGASWQQFGAAATGRDASVVGRTDGGVYQENGQFNVRGFAESGSFARDWRSGKGPGTIQIDGMGLQIVGAEVPARPRR